MRKRRKRVESENGSSKEGKEEARAKIRMETERAKLLLWWVREERKAWLSKPRRVREVGKGRWEGSASGDDDGDGR